MARRFMPELYTDETPLDERVKQLLHTGEVWECDAYFHMTRFGITVEDKQIAIEWNGIRGTADFTITLDGVPYVLETKTCADSYFRGAWDNTLPCYRLPRALATEDDLKRVVKAISATARLNDRRGHITQAALYGAALRRQPMVLMLNKDTSDAVLHVVSANECDIALRRVKQIIYCNKESTCWEDVFQYIRVPPPRKEFSKGKWTGRYMPHQSMYSSPLLDVVYQTAEDDNKILVIDYQYPESCQHLKPEMPL
jgi:hypothetical protein